MAIEWIFAPDDVARLRFAFSPLWEAVMSLRVLKAPDRHALHLPWVRAVRRRVAELPLDEVSTLIPVTGYIADFLTPPPESPLPEFTAELERVAQTPPDVAAAEASRVPGADPAVVERFQHDPEAAVRRVVDALRLYWDEVLSGYWPRILTLLETDVLKRTRRLAAGGARALFADLHETVRWTGDRLIIEKRYTRTAPLGGDGLLLVPSVFSWPGILAMCGPYRPMLGYPALGIGTLWEDGPPPAPRGLAALIGRRRAEILLALADPSSTTVLARRLSITPGAVSQHLSVLLGGGLVVRGRVGREVVYRRTPLGDALACAP